MGKTGTAGGSAAPRAPTKMTKTTCAICRQPRGTDGVYTVKLKRMEGGRVACLPRPLCADCAKKLED
jgi:hypothetical protein